MLEECSGRSPGEAASFEDDPLTRRTIQAGAVNFVQRFSGSLAVNVHFHALFLDGVHVTDGAGGYPKFMPASPLEPAEVRRVHADACRRIRRVLARFGFEFTDSGEQVSSPSDDDPADVLPFLQAASIEGKVGCGAEPGQRVPRLVDPGPLPSVRVEPAEDLLVAEGHGFSLHAATWIDADDRKRLESLIRYVTRPPLALDRLEVRGDGKVKWTLRRPWRDGTRAFVFDPLTFIGRLAALVPHPREHGWTYHGSLAPAASLRSEIVPHSDRASRPASACTHDQFRTPWAELLSRTFGFDVMRCPTCHGRQFRIAMITDPAVIARILSHIGMRPRPLPLEPPRPPPAPAFEF